MKRLTTTTIIAAVLVCGYGLDVLGAMGRYADTRVAASDELRISQDGKTISIEFPANKLGEPRFDPGPDDQTRRQRFEQLIEEVVEPYRGIVADNRLFARGSLFDPKLYPVEFVVDQSSKDWTNPDVNAVAEHRLDESAGVVIWTIRLYGGLFRRPEISEDGFSLVVCHEIGHLFGGFPFIQGGTVGLPLGLAVEMQADNFATQACLKRIWAGSENAPSYVGFDGGTINAQDIPVEVVDACAKAWNSARDRTLCHRIALAGYSVSRLWGAIAESDNRCGTVRHPEPCYPDFSTPDKQQVNNTVLTYTGPQCRLDTYFAGALCTAAFDTSGAGGLIPGVFDHIPEFSLRARDAALARSCARPPRADPGDFPPSHHPKPNGNPAGARPRCWFEPYDTID